MTQNEYCELVKLICCGDEDAEDFLIRTSRIIRTFDDLYDKDKDVPQENIKNVFFDLMFELDNNGFYIKYKDILRAQFFVFMNAWEHSEYYKNHEDQFRRIYSFFIRDYCYELEHLVAWLVGGISNSKKVGLLIREAALKQLAVQPFE